MKTRFSHGWTDPRGVFGSGSTIHPRFDIRHPDYDKQFPELNAAKYEDLLNLWVVKFGDTSVARGQLENEPVEWRYIAHLLWKRKKLTEWVDGARHDAPTETHFYRIINE